TLTLVLVVAAMSLGIDARLAAAALLPFPLMALSFWWISRHVHAASRLSLERFGALNDHVQETLAGVRTVRALGLQARSEAQFSALAAGAAEAGLSAQRWEAAYEPAVGFTLSAATALTLGIGGWLVWHGQLTVGQLTSCSRCWTRRCPSTTTAGSRASQPDRWSCRACASAIRGRSAPRSMVRPSSCCRGERWGWSGRPAPASPPCCACCCDITRRSRAGCCGTASTCRTTPWTPCAPPSPGCRRRRFSFRRR